MDSRRASAGDIDFERREVPAAHQRLLGVRPHFAKPEARTSRPPREATAKGASYG